MILQMLQRKMMFSKKYLRKWYHQQVISGANLYQSTSGQRIVGLVAMFQLTKLNTKNHARSCHDPITRSYQKSIKIKLYLNEDLVMIA